VIHTAAYSVMAETVVAIIGLLLTLPQGLFASIRRTAARLVSAPAHTGASSQTVVVIISTADCRKTAGWCVNGIDRSSTTHFSTRIATV